MSQQIQITGGAKVRNLEGVLTGTAGVVNSLGINVPDGIPQLDGSGKILVSQLPNSVMEYKGTWNAATNTPTLANGTGNAGDVYLCNVAGTTDFGAGPITFAVGDQVLYSGTTWEKASGATGTVTSVAVTESGDALTITGSPITTSGTINIGFAGTGSQYIKGDGTLATFPTTIDQAKRLITEVYNSTGATLTKGTVVYINGGQGNLPTITKAQANADNTSAQTYGVVQSDITNNNNGFVVVLGSLTDLDTQAYSVGTQLYLSGTTAGAWTSTKPSAPIHLVYVGIVVRSHPTQGVVEIRIQNGYELEELHDVAISSVANNDGIFYNSSNDLWENKTIGEVLGYTPANDSLVVHLAGTETITGAKTFSASLTAASTALFNNGILLKDGASSVSAGHFSISSLNSISLGFQSSGGRGFDMILPTSGGQITIPNGSGTLALTSDLSAYVPYTGATTNVNIGNNLFTSSNIRVDGNGSSTFGYLGFKQFSGGSNGFNGYTSIFAQSTNYLGFSYSQGAGSSKTALFASDLISSNTTRIYNLPNADGTLALTSNLSSYLPLSGGTLTGQLNGTHIVLSGSITSNTLYTTNELYYLAPAGVTSLLTLNVAGALSGTSATFSSSLIVGSTPILYGNVAIKSNSATSYFGLNVIANGNNNFIAVNHTGTAGVIETEYSTGGGYTPLSLVVSGSERMKINTNGSTAFVYRNGSGEVMDLLLSTETAESKSKLSLMWYGNETASIKFKRGGDATGGSLEFWTQAETQSIAQRMTILANGNVGIGTTNPYADSGFTSLHIGGTNGGEFILGTTAGGGGGRYFQIAAYSTSVDFNVIPSIPMTFMTAATERMRITSSGNVLIGKSDTNVQTRGVRFDSDAAVFVSTINSESTYYLRDITNSVYRFYVSGAGTIYATNTTISAISDERLKENIKDLDVGLDAILALRPRKYDWKKESGNSGKNVRGFIAQEVEAVFPDLIDEWKRNKEDETTYKSLRQDFIPILVKALQESHQIIKDLEVRIVTLESKIN